MSFDRPAFAGEITGFVATESRIFPRSPLAPVQKGTGVSLALQPEYYHDWANGTQSVLFVPFLRYDQHDGKRTHFDIRELYWQWVGSTWELRVGLRRVFWGVTESVHLVDIINQTDLVEDIDGEHKLGQPMVSFSWIRNWGVINFFVLPGFRTQTFPGVDGRLRFPVTVDNSQVQYESDAGEKHIDWAVRYSHTLGNFDLGIAHFSGTDREPRLLPGRDENNNEVLTPVYNLIDQTSLDLQYTIGGWLWKLEAISRKTRKQRMTAFAAGFEYTFANIRNSAIDLGVIAEYLFDDRDPNNFYPTAFEDDIFLGTRLGFNDVQSTELLFGAIIDRKNRSSFLNLEASRRVGSAFKATLEIRGFVNLDNSDFLYAFRRDTYIRVELRRYF
ncbi:MAG: hypothetical protein GWN55_04180 [Phycisphaerae bacterium]|nr:hypothetical protein [candidate division KSB1 bacterium]NIV00517.1 hypothetical protein [Phycisphaerae bacterium]NIR72954.1 hypothetical protein [candidate division KSB1 bacterium]NIS24626.1 hypothetical protein [candidate division KSB1 bacterium]NIT71528.1 hypothetical protein [candidate division KSB1 bacterium]